MLDFPASPSVGQKYPVSPLAGIPQYTWDGEKWTTQGGSIVSASPGTALPLGSADPAVVGTSTNFAREDHRHPIDANSVNNILADNGGLEVWQRGPSVAVPASSTPYTADRWWPFSAAVLTVSAVAGLVNGSRFAAKVQRNSGQTGVGVSYFAYPLSADETAMLRGGKAALSFVAKAGANWSGSNLTCRLYTGTGAEAKRGGTAYTGDANDITISAAITTTATVFSGVSAANVGSAVTCGELQFSWTPVGTAGADDSFTVDDVQLEVGAVPHPFARIPFSDMLEKCQAFYWKTFPYSTPPAQNAGIVGTVHSDYAYANAAGVTAIAPFPRRMRVVPTTISYAPDAATSNWTNGVAPSVGAWEWGVICQGSGSTAAGNRYQIHLTADASI